MYKHVESTLVCSTPTWYVWLQIDFLPAIQSEQIGKNNNLHVWRWRVKKPSAILQRKTKVFSFEWFGNTCEHYCYCYAHPDSIWISFVDEKWWKRHDFCRLLSSRVGCVTQDKCAAIIFSDEKVRIQMWFQNNDLPFLHFRFILAVLHTVFHRCVRVLVLFQLAYLFICFHCSHEMLARRSNQKARRKMNE